MITKIFAVAVLATLLFQIPKSIVITADQDLRVKKACNAVYAVGVELQNANPEYKIDPVCYLSYGVPNAKR